jgi:aspartate/methionine/tyrosine aminotransferase
VRLRPYPLHYADRWWLDRAGFEEALAVEGVRGVVVVQPNNPTGSVLAADEAAFVIERTAAAGAVLIADEVFLDFPAPGIAAGTLAGSGETARLVLSGLSKVAGLPQMKLGWMVVDGPPGPAAALRAGLEWIADSFLSVGGPVQAAAPAFLADRHAFLAAARHRLDGNEAHLARVLAGRPMTLRRREGGWSALVQLPAVRSDEEWALRFLDAGVVVQPGHFYDVTERALIVLSLLTPENDWADGLERMLEIVGPA